MTGPAFSPLPRSHYGDLRHMLDAAGLPSADIGEDGPAFFYLSEATGVIGYIDLECDGPDRLVRSLVVAPAHRRQGIGRVLLARLEAHAAVLDVLRLHMLTTTADTLFRAQGYRDADRTSAPSVITATAQFASVCPGNAAYLVKDIA